MKARERRAYERYLESRNYHLWHCYESFSNRKAQAWEYCEELCKKHDGTGLKVISYNTNEFTAGFVFEEDGKDMFMYITKSSDVASEIDIADCPDEYFSTEYFRPDDEGEEV